MEQRNEAQRLRIGEGRDEEAQKFAQGKSGAKIFHKGMCCAKISHKGGCCASVLRVSHNTICCAKISHKALFTRPNAKLDSFKWP